MAEASIEVKNRDFPYTILYGGARTGYIEKRMKCFDLSSVLVKRFVLVL